MSTRGYVGKLQGCALVKRLFEILNPGVVELFLQPAGVVAIVDQSKRQRFFL